MRRTRKEITALKARIDVCNLAHRLGVHVLANDRDAHCFNAGAHRNGDRNPSMRLFEDGYKCYGCGIKGDAIDMVKAIRRIGFREAVEYLQNLARGSCLGDRATREPSSPPPHQTGPKSTTPRGNKRLRCEVLSTTTDFDG